MKLKYGEDIIVVANVFQTRTGPQLLADYAMGAESLTPVVVPPEHPRDLGAKQCPKTGEWRIPFCPLDR